MKKVLTANRLLDGAAVWLGANGEWLERIDHALVARHQEAADALEEIGRTAFAGNLVLDVNLIDVEEIDHRLVPVRMREKIRATGPSIRPDLAKPNGPSRPIAA